jgi:hypothetical protein
MITVERIATMMTSKDPQIGDQYRSVGSAFRNAAWVLTEIFKSRDGIDHARLTSTHDSTECRTLALSVVADTRRFTLAEAREKTAS